MFSLDFADNYVYIPASPWRARVTSMSLTREVREYLEDRLPGRAIAAALERLLSDDDHLLRVDANERSITFRFAMYLQAELPNHDVDWEYNRTGVDPKRIDALYFGDAPADDTDGRTVYPDVIAHTRGTQANHLVVEFKKSSSAVDRQVDFQKLRGYKGDERLRYEHALFIEMTVGERPDVGYVEWIDL
jgi:hypothetical protein